MSGVPQDRAAEQALIGIAMESPTALADLRRSVRPGLDFYQPSHELIWSAICRLYDDHKPTDANAVRSELQRTRELPRCADALIESTVGVPAAPAAEYYLGIVREHAARRRLIDIGHVLATEGEQGKDEPATIVAKAEAALRKVPVGTDEEDDVAGLLDLDEFVSQPVTPDDWVIGDLLARGERLVITGTEGLGKSTLIRQLAVCAAAGIDPFLGYTTKPVRVLLVDVENPQPLMIDRLAALRKALVAHHAEVAPGHLWVNRRPEGIDLGEARDRLWLQRQALAANPDLIVIGPAYKLYHGDTKAREEDLARRVTDALDSIREQTNSALILEHHSPLAAPGSKHRDLRPIGSSLWLRWPEFGMGIQLADGHEPDADRVVELLPWRGPRDVRKWPRRLRSGGDGMPWVESNPEG